MRSFVCRVAAGSLLVLAVACGEDEPDAGPATTASGTDAADDTASDSTDPSGTSAASTGATASSPSSAPSTTATATTTTPPDMGAELAERSFVSTAVEGFTLVGDSSIVLAFAGPNLGANAGCNQLTGPWSVEGDVLVVGPMAQTQMACEPAALMDQDTWLSAVLTSRPTLTLDGDTLTIHADGATVTMLDEEAANPDRPLEGTAWTVDTLIAGEAASSLTAGGRAPTLLFEGGRLQVDTGCNTGSGGYIIEGDTISFEPIALTRMACVDPGAADTEQHVIAVLDGSATAAIDADRLTLTNGANGLGAVAPPAD